MNKPDIVEVLNDDGEHSHWKLINPTTGETIWEEKDPAEERILIEGDFYRRGDIYDIYDIERDKEMFFNRDAGFIVQTIGTSDVQSKKHHYGEGIPYDSSPQLIYEKKNKWSLRMESAIKLWKNQK